jgi:hypothetical protein
MLSDGALDSVLSQFYHQSDQLNAPPPSLASPADLPSPQLLQAQGGSLGHSFQYSTGSSPITSPPPALSTQQQPSQAAPQRDLQFVRVSSAGALPICSDVSPTTTRPPLQRGKSEPSRHLQDKVRNLNVQQLKQMEELDKQKTIAEVQYSELLLQLLPSSAQQVKPEPSDQQQVLQRVLSDPSLVKILRSVLLSGSQQQGVPVNSPPLIAPAPPRMSDSATPPHLQPRKGSASAPPPPTQRQLFGQQQITSPVHLLSPTDLAMVSILSPFGCIVTYFIHCTPPPPPLFFS